MLRRLGRPLLAVGTAATLGGAAYTYYSSRPKDFQLAYRVRDASGRSGTATTTIKYISGQVVDEKINQRNEQHSTVDQKGRTWSWHTAQLNSNDPIEDALAYNIVEKSQGDGNRMFFAVMDGHGGPWTSRLLAKTLIPSVALELELLDQLNAKQSSSTWFGLLYETLRSILPKSPFAGNAMVDTYSGPNAVASAIQRAFSKLDKEIISSPLRFLNKPRDHLTADPLFAPTVLPARSGSCALLTMIDTSDDSLYVACTGDCRAVAGYIDPTSGECCAEELTLDQTGRNPDEVRRIQAEHPPDEAESVIRRGRVLGGLEPSRAFGDARYKWSRGDQSRLASHFNGFVDPPFKAPPPDLKTPPYVTCNPEITYRRLTQDSPPPSTTAPYRFLILATDGLWDELSSKEVVALVSGHLNGLRGSVSKGSITVNNLGETQSSRYNGGPSKPNWIFEDENIAAHLIRNAFASTSENADQLERLLSIPSPLSRRYRDDTSVLVLWWKPESEGKSQG